MLMNYQLELNVVQYVCVSNYVCMVLFLETNYKVVSLKLKKKVLPIQNASCLNTSIFETQL